jgi:hypothetical protein
VTLLTTLMAPLAISALFSALEVSLCSLNGAMLSVTLVAIRRSDSSAAN